MEVDIREIPPPSPTGPVKKPSYKIIGFAVMAAAILLAAVLAYFVFSEVILPIYDGGNGGNGTPTIIYYGPGYGRHLLLGQNTTSIVIEVDYVVGYRPSDQMLDELRATVQMISEKITTMAPPQEIPMTYNDYNRDILVELENQYRTTSPEDGTQASIYVLCLNGLYEGSSSVLGVAYNNTSFAIMEQNVKAINIPMILRRAGLTVEDFETSVAIHEMGHLGGLVNLNYTSERDHEDPDHPHHCIDDDCVLFWALETSPSSYIQNYLSTGNVKPPTTFCDDCIFDLNKIKAGEY